MIEKRHTTEDLLAGVVLLIDKQKDWTSFDVVNKVRSQIKFRKNIPKIKVGHAGTLDPLATGLLIVCTGKKTKEIEQYQSAEKEYIADIKIGETTPSFDLETDIDKFFPTEHINETEIRKVIESFVGESEQMPPIFSAKRVDGKRAYKSARKGKPFQLEPVKIHIREIELLKSGLPILQIRVICSKGTYIRALARDIGAALNSGAHLIDLRRTKIGSFSVDDAITVDEFEKML